MELIFWIVEGDGKERKREKEGISVIEIVLAQWAFFGTFCKGQNKV